MKFTKNIKLMIAAAFAVFSLSACSGGSTATGLGLSVGGSWAGQLRVGNSVYANFGMSLQQEANDAEDPFSGSKLIGTFSSDDKCIGGGTIDGTVSGSSINLAIDSLSMSGEAGNTTMSGVWNSAIEGCTTGGTWSASR